MHARWGLRFAGLDAFSLILIYLLEQLPLRKRAGAILWPSLILSIGLLGISNYLPLNIPFPLHTAISAAMLKDPGTQGVPNNADPLDHSYRPIIDTNQHDYPASVWVTDSLQKVHQDTGTPGSVHWAIL